MLAQCSFERQQTNKETHQPRRQRLRWGRQRRGAAAEAASWRRVGGGVGAGRRGSIALGVGRGVGGGGSGEALRRGRRAGGDVGAGRRESVASGAASAGAAARKRKKQGSKESRAHAEPAGPLTYVSLSLYFEQYWDGSSSPPP